MSSLFPTGAENVEEYQPKVHFLKQNDLVLCDTKNAKEGTKDIDKVTCLRCTKLLERIDEIEERGNVPLTLDLTVTVESPPITKANGKKILLTWLNMLPDDVQLELKSGYSSPTTFIATWKEKRDAVQE